MILIVGDSWACGEWDGQGCQRSNISHPGVAQYLREHGYQVVNLGKGGGSNLESASRVADFLAEENSFVNQVQCVLVFQTEWTRDVVNLWNIEEFQRLNFDYQQYKDRLIAKFYYQLSQTARQTSIPIYMIGGCSDTIWLDLFEQEYPGVRVICQSWVNLMLHHNHRIDQPVLARFGAETQPLIEYAKSKMTSSNVQILLDDLDLAEQRNQQWWRLTDNNLLCADHTHPNRQAHKILFDHIISTVQL
jgi:lysophospholipase L1-like esterase